ncbi:hypothetical protein [Archangium lipolyticum]|uniref:hypothetical protein n=1 Tax=Archangium lipolyticum TaxID=2970465 RepID=UPI00214A4776|nr:hypothetical protein [Archangium lipolyticum]
MRTLSKLYLATGAVALSACTVLSKEQTPVSRQTCAPETVALMKKLSVESGQRGTLTLESSQPGGAEDYGVYRQGPITSQLASDVGGLPAGTLVEGVLWIDTGKVQVHYTQARLPDGQVHPVCLVLGSSAPGGIYAEAGTTPSAITLPKTAPVTVVDKFE